MLGALSFMMMYNTKWFLDTILLHKITWDERGRNASLFPSHSKIIFSLFVLCHSISV